MDGLYKTKQQTNTVYTFSSLQLITPRACARGNVIGRVIDIIDYVNVVYNIYGRVVVVVVVVSTKIAISRDVGI